ncbi:MAG: hypothetical protein M0R06_00120 [Sphaerochaeta sp.]|jgi:hypothetical protein|nr:hypothetical protein [Sphaerochaeta sp.]
MFCDGKCINGKKRCGMYAELITQKQGAQPEKIDRCIFYAILDLGKASLDSINRLHAAMNSARNEDVETGKDLTKTIATGFLGMIHMFSGNDEATKKIRDLGALSLGVIESKKQEALTGGE